MTNSLPRTSEASRGDQTAMTSKNPKNVIPTEVALRGHSRSVVSWRPSGGTVIQLLPCPKIVPPLGREKFHTSRLVRGATSVGMTFLGFGILFVALGLLTLPGLVQARAASHDEILDAMNAGLALTDAGFVCSENKETFGDCIKTTQKCSDTPWAAYAKTNYEVAGGLVVAKQGITKIGALAYLRADSGNLERAPGPVLKGTCYGECKGDETFEACKGKNPGTPFRAAEDLTYEQCAAKCQPRAIDQKCAGTLPPVAPVAAATGGPAPTASFAGDATCFRPAECADQSGIYEAYEKCGSGKGRCYAAEPAIDLNVPIGDVKRIQGFNNYVIAAYRYLISVGAVAATVMFVYGAFFILAGTVFRKSVK